MSWHFLASFKPSSTFLPLETPRAIQNWMTCLEGQSLKEDGDLLSKTLPYGNSAASLVVLPAYKHIRTDLLALLVYVYIFIYI